VAVERVREAVREALAKCRVGDGCCVKIAGLLSGALAGSASGLRLECRGAWEGAILLCRFSARMHRA
jgi:hypothetical protein